MRSLLFAVSLTAGNQKKMMADFRISYARREALLKKILSYFH